MQASRTSAIIPLCGTVTLLLIFSAGPVPALTLDPTVDGILLGVGAALGGGTELMDLLHWPPPPLTAPEEVYPAPALDLSSMFSYSADTDVASTFFEAAALAIPGVFLLGSNPDQAFAGGVGYAESLSFAIASKNVIKTLFPRYRPYTYSGGAPGVDPSEDEKSYPSGHSTVAFAAAGYSAYLLLQGYPSSAWYLPLVVADYGLAFLTASYRVFSGMHFVSDVLAGAVLGTLCGLVLPALAHRP